MDQSKIKRLEAAGWKTGSVQEFLGLSDEESAYIELRFRLSDALKARRQAARLSQSALAIILKSSQSRVAKMEANDTSVSIDLFIRSLMLLGVTLDELANIMSMQRMTESPQTDQRIIRKSRRKLA